MNNIEGLDDLTTRLSKMVRELPNNGHERSMTPVVDGDNHGNINFGNQITINFAPQPREEIEPRKEESPPASTELHEERKEK